MKWILVVVGIFNGQIIADNEGIYNNMNDCFLAREMYIWETFSNPDGQPPVNFQVVCIPSDKYQ